MDLEAAPGVLLRLAPDLAGLQEVDRRAARSGFADQTRWLAGRLGWKRPGAVIPALDPRPDTKVYVRAGR